MYEMLVVLRYADNTIMCQKHDTRGVGNMKLMLYMYEMLVGLRINFTKSEIVMTKCENLGQQVSQWV